MNDDPVYDKARRKALRYLTYRGRSVEEVRSKLREQGFDQALIQKVIDRLSDLGYLDDGNFANQWARHLATLRLWGDKKIGATLREKGMPRDLVARAIAEARAEKDEKSAIRELVEKRLRREPPCEVFSYKGRRRLMQALAGRGFSVGTILDVLREMEEARNDSFSAGRGGDEGDIQ